MAPRGGLRCTAALLGASVLAGGCAGASSSDDRPARPDYSVERDPVTGEATRRYTPIGPDARGCMQYRIDPMAPGEGVPQAIAYWDGERYVFEADRCVPVDPEAGP